MLECMCDGVTHFLGGSLKCLWAHLLWVLCVYAMEPTAAEWEKVTLHLHFCGLIESEEMVRGEGRRRGD